FMFSFFFFQAEVGIRYLNVTGVQTCALPIYTIKSMGFVDYFLIVWDFIRFAKEQKIPVGPGRGSAAGSIVSYALGITDIDPLKRSEERRVGKEGEYKRWSCL